MTPSGPPPRVLAVRFGSIGDLILITPLLRAIKARHPDGYLAVVTKERYRSLLAHNPHVDTVIGLAAEGSLLDLAARLRAEHFTHRLDLHGNLRSWALRALVPGRWRGYSKHRLARSLLIRTHRNTYPPGTPPVPERMFTAARDLDVTPDGDPAGLVIGGPEQAGADAWLSGHLAGDGPLIVAAPMAAHATKRWPVGHWQGLVTELTALGLRVAVVGGPGDRETCRAVADAGGPAAASAAGEMDLMGTGGLLVRAAVTVAGDTGVMHMSTAVGTPVVALYGPTVEALGYFPYRARATVLERAMACRPCSKMGGPVCPLGHHRCLVDITPAEVQTAVEGWL